VDTLLCHLAQLWASGAPLNIVNLQFPSGIEQNLSLLAGLPQMITQDDKFEPFTVIDKGKETAKTGFFFLFNMLETVI